MELTCVLLLSLSQNGQTPLMVAAEQGNLEITQELIRRGANVNLDDVVSTQTVHASPLAYCPPPPATRVPSSRLKTMRSHQPRPFWKKEKPQKILTFHLAGLTCLGLSPAGLRNHNDDFSHSCFD